MKRCPQCSFIYEDDQIHCDLDGAELAHGAGALPLPEITAPRRAITPVKARRWGFTFLPIAGIVLTGALFLGYRAIPDRAARRDATHPPAKLNAPPRSEPDLVLAPTPAAPTHTPTPPLSATSRKAVRRVPTTVRRPSELTDSPPRKQEGKKAEPVGAGAKKESKLGSLLKKTGRILKKPFKF